MMIQTRESILDELIFILDRAEVDFRAGARVRNELTHDELARYRKLEADLEAASRTARADTLQLADAARHEASHTMAAAYYGLPIRQISIGPDATGVCDVEFDQASALGRAACYFAGVVCAEDSGDPGTATADLENGRRELARPAARHVTEKDLKAAVRWLLKENKGRVSALADRLVRQKTVTGHEAVRILGRPRN